MDKAIKRIIAVLTDVDADFAERPIAEQIKDAELIRNIFDKSPVHSIDRALAIIEGA
jgi:hypothetical protein